MQYFDHVVEVEFTAVNSDCLSATSLASPPTNGTMFIVAASTVNTATLALPQYGAEPDRTVLLQKRTDGIPEFQAQPTMVIPVIAGKRPVLVLGGTPGTVHLVVGFNRSRK